MPNRLLITPAAIKALNPCAERWAVYRAAHPGDMDTAHPFVSVLDSNGLDDALWVLYRAPGPVALRLRLLLGARCAERVLHLYETRYPDDSRPRGAIAAARAWADAIGTPAEGAKREAAGVAREAAAYAAYAAAAADAAAAAYAAARATERRAQADELRALLASEEARNA